MLSRLLLNTNLLGIIRSGLVQDAKAFASSSGFRKTPLPNGFQDDNVRPEKEELSCGKKCPKPCGGGKKKKQKKKKSCGSSCDKKPTGPCDFKEKSCGNKCGPPKKKKSACDECPKPKKKSSCCDDNPCGKKKKKSSCDEGPTVPNVKLSCGCEMPQLAMGLSNMCEDDAYKAICMGVDAGYRHFDCARLYENESGVGCAIDDLTKKCVIKREDIFVTSKLWNTYHRPHHVAWGMHEALTSLKLCYLDLFLIHTPMAYIPGLGLYPRDCDKIIYDCQVDLMDTWRAMEKLVDEGLTRCIGVSNFNCRQLEYILCNCNIPPAVNQIECHPYLPNNKLRDFCNSKCIHVTAYSPLGSPDNPSVEDLPRLLDDKVVCKIAKQYCKTPAQILLRFHMDRHDSAVVRARCKDQLRENMEIFDFELCSSDIEKLECLEKDDFRAFGYYDVCDHYNYPFSEQ